METEIERNNLNLLAFDAAPVGLVLTENRVIRACNRTFCELSGYRRDELINASFRKLYRNQHDFERVRDIGLDALTAGSDYSDERILRRRDGTIIWCRFRAHSMNPEDPMSQAVLSYSRLTPKTRDGLLTRRERDVVHHLGRGATSKEIAQALGLSPRSVEDVRSRLLKKFSARNATELLANFTNLEI